MQGLRRFRCLINILNVFIAVLVVANLLCFVSCQMRPQLDQQAQSVKPQPPELNFSPEELEAAIVYLNLPTWIRSYRHCSSPESEVTCSQVVRAYRLIKGWEETMSLVPVENRTYFVLKHPNQGLGNKMTTDVVAFTLALMSNRSVLVTSNCVTSEGWKPEHAYSYPKSVFTDVLQLPEVLHKKAREFATVPLDRYWSCFDVNKLLLSDRQFVGMDDLMYASMVYVNKQTAEFAWQNFGGHAAYFISNYFSRFSDNATATARKLLDAVPRNKALLGVHIRYHRAGRYFSRGVQATMATVYEEIDKRLQNNTDMMIALATDSKGIVNAMQLKYGDRMIMTDSPRLRDSDHISAQSDMVLVMGCDTIIGTYRSTFSWIIVSRSGQRAWWIEKESAHCLPSSNSQAGCVSMLYHWRDSNNWRTNDRVVYCGKDHRHILNLFYEFFVL